MKFKFKQFKKDIMENAHIKLNKWRLKKMVKDKEIPVLKENKTEDLGKEINELDNEEEDKEEGKMQLVTNEQLMNLKLDNLSSQVQELTSKVGQLVEVLKRKK